MPPLGMAQVAAYLRQRHYTVHQDDWNIKFHRNGLAARINKAKPSRRAVRGFVERFMQDHNYDIDARAVLLSAYISRMEVNKIIAEEIALFFRKNCCTVEVIGNKKSSRRTTIYIEGFIEKSA